MEQRISSSLFTEAKIGPITLPNRIIRAAAFEGMCPGNSPSPQLYNYHKSVAEGGTGMTTIAYASVSRDGLSFPHQLWMRKEIIPELRKITDAVHAAGAAASIQLGHCGNMAKKSIAGTIPVSASSGLNIYSPGWAKAMKYEDIRRIVLDFGKAVQWAAEAGFDAVEIHAGHGYLLSQFLSPYTNRRKDDFGGDLENRMRFMKLVMDKVLEAAGGKLAVIVKMNMRDGFRGGMDIEESLKVAETLEKIGVHALVLSGGFVSKTPMYILRGAMPVKTMTYYMDNFWLKAGVRLAGKWMIKSHPFTEAYFLEDARVFRKNIKIPLIYVGGLISRDKMEEVINCGFEFVSMARALLNDPFFVSKIKNGEKNRSDCEHVNYCIARMYSKEAACYRHQDNLPQGILKELDKNKARDKACLSH